MSSPPFLSGAFAVPSLELPFSTDGTGDGSESSVLSTTSSSADVAAVEGTLPRLLRLSPLTPLTALDPDVDGAVEPASWSGMASGFVLLGRVRSCAPMADKGPPEEENEELDAPAEEKSVEDELVMREDMSEC